MKLLILMLSLFATLCYTQNELPDMVILKNGGIFKGKVIKIKSSSIEFKEGQDNIMFEFENKDIKNITLSSGKVITFPDGLPVPSDSKKPSELAAEEYFNKGKEDLFKKDYQSAINNFSKAIQLDPNNTEAYLFRGNTKLELKDYVNAIQDYNKVLKLNPTHSTAYNNRGVIKRKLKDYKGSIEDHTWAIQLDPKNGDAYYNRGLVKFYAKDYQGAKMDYNKVLELNPNDEDALNDLKMIDGNTRNINSLNNTIKESQKQIQIAKKNAERYFQDGKKDLIKEEYSLANTNFSKAIELDSNYLEAYYYRGFARLLLGDIEGVMQDYNKTSDTFYNIGLKTNYLNEYIRSIKYYKKVLELNPNDSKAIAEISKLDKILKIINNYKTTPTSEISQEKSKPNIIQEMINNSSNNSIINIPPGEFYLNEVIEINNRSNLKIIFNKETYVILNNSESTVLDISNSNNITIKNGYFTHAGDYCYSQVISIVNSKSVILDGSNINGCGFIGVTGQRSKNIKITNCYIHNNIVSAFDFDEYSDVIISNNKIIDKQLFARDETIPRGVNLKNNIMRIGRTRTNNSDTSEIDNPLQNIINKAKNNSSITIPNKKYVLARPLILKDRLNIKINFNKNTQIELLETGLLDIQNCKNIEIYCNSEIIRDKFSSYKNYAFFRILNSDSVQIKSSIISSNLEIESSTRVYLDNCDISSDLSINKCNRVNIISSNLNNSLNISSSTFILIDKSKIIASGEYAMIGESLKSVLIINCDISTDSKAAFKFNNCFDIVIKENIIEGTLFTTEYLPNNVSILNNKYSGFIPNISEKKYFLDLGVSKNKLSNYNSAIDCFNRLISIDSNNGEAYYNRGISFYGATKYQYAIEDLNRAISLQVNDVSLYYYLGLSKIFLWKKDGCNDLNKALQLGHTEASAAINKYCK